MLRTTHYVDGQEVRAGVRITVHSNYDHISFRVAAICDSTNPDRWHGEVTLADTVIVRTGSTDSHERAGREAEAALKACLVRVFSDPSPAGSTTTSVSVVSSADVEGLAQASQVNG